MTIRLLILSFFVVLNTGKLSAQQDSLLSTAPDYQLSLLENRDSLEIATPENQKFKYRESKRFVAAVLCLALGPFGMHRLYLGTTPQVAAAYSVTLGGIGFVPVVDFFLIAFSKDYSRFKNNPNVIMWGK